MNVAQPFNKPQIKEAVTTPPLSLSLALKQICWGRGANLEEHDKIMTKLKIEEKIPNVLTESEGWFVVLFLFVWLFFYSGSQW